MQPHVDDVGRHKILVDAYTQLASINATRGKVHINERFLHPDPYMPKISWAVSNQESIEEVPEENNTDPEALITITPIVQVEHDEEYNEEEISFTFRNELRIRSFHWGENRLRIQCRDICKDISWHQRKSGSQKN